MCALLINIDQSLALVASLGTLFSAVATFLTVRQMVKQREASYRPELAIPSVLVGGGSRSSEGGIPNCWVVKHQSEKENASATSEEILIPEVSLPLRNIGLGSAKNLELYWDFPFENAVAEVNELAQRSLSAAYFSFENGMLSLKSEKYGAYHSIWNNQKTSACDYVLPIAVEEEAVFLKLPDAYVNIVSAWIYFAIKSESTELFDGVPPLSLKIEYLDIGESKRVSKFDILLHIAMIQGGGSNFSGVVKVKKIH